LYVLAGDGKGSLGTPQAVRLTGVVRTMDVSDGGYVAVSIDGPEGLRVAILAPSAHGLTEVGSYATPGQATSLAWGSLGGGLDLAVGAGSNVMLIYGPLSQNPETESVTLPVAVQALAVGDYIWDRDGRQEIAVLGSDGTVRILQHGTLDTRPLTAADIPGRRAALRARPSGLPSPMAMGEWTVAKQLAGTGVSLAGPASRSTFSSPRLAAASTQDLMLLNAGKNQVNLLDTSGKAGNATATIAFSGTPVAAVAMPQKINAGRDLVVLTSSATEPMVTEAAPDPTFNVTTTADIDNLSACATNSTVTSGTEADGILSLREAVCEANNNGAATSVINLPAGTYDLAMSTNGGKGSSTTTSGELQVGIVAGATITISGAGQNSTIIQQTDGHDRLIEQDELVAGNIPITLQNLTLTGGVCNDTSGLDCVDNGGGAVLGGASGDNMTITNVTMSNNESNVSTTEYNTENGGALTYVGGALNISDSTFTDNKASGYGGAIFAEVGYQAGNIPSSFTFTNSTFTNNEALTDNIPGNVGQGGAIDFSLAGNYPASITGSTFTGNEVLANNVNEPGGAIAVDGDGFSMSTSRIVGNIAPGGGTGVYLVLVSATLNNNWWGCNAGPNQTGCDSILQDVSGTNEAYTPSSWLVLSISAGATQVDASATTGLTADLTHNSSGTGGFNVPGSSVPDSTPVSFGATLGTISGASTTLTNGTGTATFTAGTTAGAGSGTTTVDNQTASVTIDVVGGTSTSAAVDDAGTGNAWSGTETAGASAYATATVTPGGSGPTPTGNVTYTFYSGSTCTSTIVGTSTATLSGGSVPKSATVGPLGAATYSLSARYNGDPAHQGSSSSCHSFTVNKAQPATTVTSNQNPSTAGQSVTFTATVSGGYSASGLVGFTSNGVGISGCGGVSLSGGQAQCMTSTLVAGTDAIVATYSGDGNNLGSSGTLSGGQQVNAITPTVTVTVQSKVNSAQALPVTVTVSGGAGNPTPTGSVTLSSGSYTSAATTLTAGSTTITIPAGSLAVGSDTLTAAYTPDAGSSSIYSGATGAAPVTVSQAIGTCTTANPNPNPNPESFAAVGDFNGDCRSDILWHNSSTEQVYEWLMNGTTFTGSGSPGSLTSDWVIQDVGDFNGDGMADILWRNSTTGEVVIWLMNGTTMTSSTSLGNVSADWSIAGVGDFNGDGYADVLWQNTSGELYLWLMNGTTIAGGGIVGNASGWNVAGIGDFNGDGDADILWRNSTTGQVYVWLMNGTTITSMGSPGTPSSDWVIAGVGDFNGDGKSDILWRNSTTGQVYLWFMNGTGIASSGSVSYVSSDWVIQGVGDYDGSGRAGILWRNSTSEQVYIWLMNGTALTSSGSPGTPDNTWQIAP
ncbi:MAG: FG-GAP-like repeat-containing protein, partial [Acidobacteriaceae bacterium]